MRASLTIIHPQEVPMSELTKRALEQSLKNLLLQKPLNKITIATSPTTAA